MNYLKYEIMYPKIEEKAFQSMLKKGWQLYGNPFLDKEGDLCQAITLEVKKKVKKVKENLSIHKRLKNLNI